MYHVVATPGQRKNNEIIKDHEQVCLEIEKDRGSGGRPPRSKLINYHQTTAQINQKLKQKNKACSTKLNKHWLTARHPGKLWMTSADHLGPM